MSKAIVLILLLALIAGGWYLLSGAPALNALTYQREGALATMQAAGAEALAIGDTIRATAAAESYQAAAATEAASVRRTETAAATATQAAAYVQAVTIEAARTRTALEAQGTQIAVSAYATAVAQQAVINNQIVRREEITTQQRELTAAVWPWLAVIGGVVGAALALYLLSRILLDWTRWRVMPTAPNGAAPLVLDRRSGGVYNPNHDIYPANNPGAPLFPPLPVQERFAHDRLKVEALQALAAGNRAPSPATALPAFTQAAPGAGDSAPVIEAEWREIEQWRGGALPMGMGKGGLITAPSTITPHLLVAGTTGAGKTFHALRPVTAAALADGQQVIILDRSGVDYKPFENHPNCALVRLDDPADASRYLTSVYGELQRRLRQMADAGATLWDAWRGAPRLLVVLDEFSNLADDLDGAGRAELWRRARMLTSEGRKTGIALAIAVQDTTARAIDPRIKRTSARWVFQLVDAETSRIFLGADGAERLQKRHFLTVLGGELTEGVAFAPSDDDIRAYLAAHPAPALPAPSWLAAETDAEPTLTPAFVPADVRVLANLIHASWLSGASKRQMALAAGGEYAGAFAARIDRAITYLESTEPVEGEVTE